MKRCATGLSVRFFSVTIATGHGRTGTSTGNTFTDSSSALRCMMELGKAVMKGPVASKLARKGTEKVTRRGFGTERPRAGILREELRNNRRQHRGCRGFRASDPYFSHRRIGQELDVSDPLLQLIEGRLASRQQRATVGRCLDSTRAAIEQSHADRV